MKQYQESREKAFSNLLLFKKRMDMLCVPFFLDGGTLLGAYRDGDFCDDDEDDIDLAVMAEYKPKIPEITNSILDEGFELYFHWRGDKRAPGLAPQLSFIKDGFKIDLFFVETKDNYVWSGVYDSEDHLVPRVFPKNVIGELGVMEFRGVDFLTPLKVDEYLTAMYGDWRTPIHRKYYDCYNTEQSKSLRPDFIFF